MTNNAKHTPGPWAVAFRGMYILAKNGDTVARVSFFDDQARANAALAAAAPELLDELKSAHQIIRNALAVMTPEQKCQWGELNAAAGVDGEGATRANERAAVIAKATGGAQ